MSEVMDTVWPAMCFVGFGVGWTLSAWVRGLWTRVEFVVILATITILAASINAVI